MNKSGENRKCIRGIVVFAISLAGLLVFLVVAPCFGEEYFVLFGMTEPYSKLGTAAIYEIDTATDSLSQVWTLPARDRCHGVRLYSDARMLTVFSGSEYSGVPDRVYVIPFDSVSSSLSPLIDNRADSTPLRTECQLIEDVNNQYFFRIVRRDLSNKSLGEVRDEQIFDIRNRKAASGAVLSSSATRRLAGTGPSYPPGSSSVDVEPIELKLANGNWYLSGSELLSDAPPVPDSLVRMKTSYGWTVIANEPRYCVANSIPERNGLTSRELLIFNRGTGSWASVVIPGPATVVGLLGGWLGGIITDDSPKTDHVKRLAETPIPREEAVLVNLATLHSFTVHLGPWCRLLMIRDDVVFYCVSDQLYKARIQNDDFVERQLLVKDFKVNGIRWAFGSRD